MRYGIIGTGNMGSLLTQSLISSGALNTERVTVYNRTLEKAERLQSFINGLKISPSIEKLQDESDIIFICVKPHDYHHILSQLKPSASQCVVSITSPVSVTDLEDRLPCQVARIVPSITNQAHAGVSLFTFGQSVTEEYKEELIKVFSSISRPVEIEEPYIRVASDIVSCGPAFVGFLLENMIKAAHEVGDIPMDKATELMQEMVVGLGGLLEKKIFTFPELIKKVTVKGGVTGEGITALEENINDTFVEMFKATHYKHYLDKQSLHL
ncbi:late competence protein ComER [Halobacillus sp. Marseille-Q1614]|uniref:late competence protein ComER n=1 Tax=Halobacillus sp. Marseille-Q1614 TaxID=2709134 RepID=UPI00156E5C97|nr:late competence protein ComER [Halobacillus sp. Marseille-Q1614]